MKSVLLLAGLLMTTAVSAFEQLYVDRLMTTKICHHCNLADADLQDHNFSGADMSEALLKRINLSGAKLVGAWFTRSRIHDANFENADLSTALLDYSLLIGANLRGVNFSGAKLNFADLTDADLTGATMEDAVIRGVKFCNTTMPDGSINNSGC